MQNSPGPAWHSPLGQVDGSIKLLERFGFRRDGVLCPEVPQFIEPTPEFASKPAAFDLEGQSYEMRQPCITEGGSCDNGLLRDGRILPGREDIAIEEFLCQFDDSVPQLRVLITTFWGDTSNR